MEIKGEEIIFSAKPKSRPVSYDLSAELKKQGYQEQSGKFGIITNNFASSPANNQGSDVFDTSLEKETKTKRHSTSSLLNKPKDTQPEDNFDILLSEIDN